MFLLLIYLSVALFISFLCSILESVLLAIPYPYLKAKSETGNAAAVRMIHYKEDIDKPLSAILSLNTVAHTVGAAGVGAQATVVFGEAYFGLVSAVLTILILVLTEIIPKTLGANYSRELMGITSVFIKILIIITYPLVYLSAKITGILSRKETMLTTSREEISVLANIGNQEGIFEDKENRIIQNLIKLKSIRLSDIMTPRVVVVLANEEMSLQEFLTSKDLLHFSRIPIYEGNRDHVTGYVMREKVFEKIAENEGHLKLKDIKRKILTMDETASVLYGWDCLLKHKEHIALLVDKYGGVDGVVTFEDVIETLLGFEILDEKDEIADMQAYAMERWKAKQIKYQYLKSEQ